MKVLVVDNSHIIKDSNGNYYSPSIYSYSFLERYLKVFDGVKFVGKVKELNNEDITKMNLLSGSGVEIVNLPWYQGFKQMLSVFPQLIKVYRHAADDCSCCIFRVAQVESFLAYMFRKNKKSPYAVEVVNDPETFLDMPWFMRRFSVYMLKKMTKKANGASYVTKTFLQQKYPNSKKGAHFQSYYSSVNLEKEDILDTPIEYNLGDRFKIVHVSNAINNDIKGHYALINTAKILIERGYDIEVVCIGDGSKVNEYENYIKSIGINDKVVFLGRLNSKNDLLNKLRESNLLLLPTKMEGLPRTIIEAMSVGLPCLSTPIAGIPELLDEEYMFDSDDVTGFANKVEELIQNPNQLKKMSEENLIKAHLYSSDILEKRRTIFYSHLREIAEKGNNYVCVDDNPK